MRPAVRPDLLLEGVAPLVALAGVDLAVPDDFFGVDWLGFDFDEAKYAELVVSSSTLGFGAGFFLGVAAFFGFTSSSSSSSLITLRDLDFLSDFAGTYIDVSGVISTR